MSERISVIISDSCLCLQLTRVVEEQEQLQREVLEARRKADILADRALKERLAAEDEEARLKQRLEMERLERVSFPMPTLLPCSQHFRVWSC